MTSITSVEGAVESTPEDRHSLLLRKIGGAAGRRRQLTMPTILFVAGSIVLPIGVALLVIGWVGVGNSVFLFNQLSYLASGCLFGLGLIIVGGFLYFGHWQVQTLEAIRADGRAAQQRHEELVAALTALVGGSAASVDETARLVVTQSGSLVHRAECTLVRNRSTRQVTAAEVTRYRPCSVCRPTED
jgi:hypothetical protein